jgi:ferredoxin
MPTVVINDIAMEARVGERILSVARRNGAHIGFACDGNGICQTCQCRVLAGADLLNAPNEAERAWLPDGRLGRGHRLACQAALRHDGRVELLTGVEELRRQTLDLIDPPAGSDAAEALAPLVENLLRLTIDQLSRYPFNLISTFLRVGPQRFLLPIVDADRYVQDAARVTGATLRAPIRRASPARPRASGPYEARLDRAAEALRRARENAAR